MFCFLYIYKNLIFKVFGYKESNILGAIIFVVCLLCGFPYALLIGVLTSVTALIPIFGALIACVAGAILIAITNPLQASA